MNARAGALANKKRLLLIVAVMILSGLCPSPARAQGIPAQNKAVYLGWGGYVDTQADFDSFFNSDHTLMVWFMPQYLYAYRGPIFSNTGAGTYLFGMEDYRMGDGGFIDPGSPVITLQVGSKQKLFLVPSLTKDEWHHLALIRTENMIRVYMDGVYLQPVKNINAKTNDSDPDIDIQVNINDSPKGMLRFGRQETDLSTSTQVYGLIDDVAVFNRALAPFEIDHIRNDKRLTGSEISLIFGWCFDQPKKSDPALPPVLNAKATFNGRATRVNVTPNRFDIADGVVYYAPYLLGTVADVAQLPFKAYEVWKVNQGYDSRGGSHNGFASFSYDFSMAYPTGDQIYPNGSILAPVFSATHGFVSIYIKDKTPGGDEDEENVVFIRTASNEYLSYRHNEPFTINPNFDTGICDPNLGCGFPLGNPPEVNQGDFVAKVGQNAKHLHFGGCNHPFNSTRVTFPVAFDNYFVSDDQGVTWKHIDRGYPRKGQYIKRAEN